MPHLSRGRLIPDYEGGIVMDQMKSGDYELARCPKCGGYNTQKFGWTAGRKRQKWKCRDRSCGRQFVEGSDHLINPDVKRTVLNLLAAGTKPQQIARALPISLRWVQELKRRMNAGDR